MTDTVTDPWTTGRLRAVIGIVDGRTPHGGGPDLRAFAARIGISVRTAQRWTALTAGPDHPAPVPAARKDQVLAALGPDEATLEDEAREARYAREAADVIAMPRQRYVKPTWRQRHWLEPHRVFVVDVDEHLRQVRVARVGSRADDTNARISRELPHKFLADLAALNVLRQVGPWRLRPPAVPPKSARTRCWLTGAPDPLL